MVVVGIVGAGFMGTTHAKAYAKLSNVRVKYIVDQIADRSQALASAVGSQGITDMAQLMTDPEVDLVDITLPTPFHPMFVIQALQAGKHVIVEKPLALTTEDGEKMITVARECGRMLMVAHVLRFQPEYAAIHRIVMSNRLGKPRLGHTYRLSNMPQWAAWFRDPQKTGGAVIDLQIHDVDFLNWLFGRPQNIYSRGIMDKNGGWNSLFSLIGYENGSASVECSFNMPMDYPFTCGLRLECEWGEIEYHFRAGGGSFESGEPVSYLKIHEEGKPDQNVVVQPGDGFEAELDYFTSCVEKQQPPDYVTVEDAFLALQTVKAAQKSLETGERTDL